MQERSGVKPDMTCLGKIVGGGLPLAAYGGRRNIMQKVAPLGPVYQAGTLSGNPIAVSAALAMLPHLTADLYARLESLGARLEAGLLQGLSESGVVGSVQRVGSMITLFFAKGPIKSYDDAKNADTERFGRFHREMIARGEYWPPSQFEAAFISGAHTDADIDRTIENAKAAIKK